MRAAAVAMLCSYSFVAAAGEVASAPPPVPAPQTALVDKPVELAESIGGCKKLAADKKLRLTLHGEVGPAELVAALAPLSCKPIVMGGAISRSGKVSIDAPDLLSPGEATRLLVTGLDSLGLSLEDTGAALRVVDSARGREVASGLGEKGRGREAFVLRLVRLSEAGAEEIANTVSKLRSKDGEVVAVPQSRSLLLVDRLSQVERMEALARALDRPAVPTRIFVLPTNRQRPSDLIEVIEKIALAPGGKNDKSDPNRPILIAVDGARAILLSGGELAYRRVEALLQRIDPPLLPGEERSGRIAVMYLKHVTAEELAVTLKEVLTGARTASKAPSGPAAALVQPGAVEGDVRITADKVTNALVVAASVADIESVRELVARLDLPRRQIYVEAVIVDLSADLSRNVGITLQAGGANQAGTLGGVVSSTSPGFGTLDLKSLASAIAPAAGLNAALIGKSFEVAGISVPSLGVVLHALENSKNANILSRPHLLTLDHNKATLSVGQKIPFPQASSASSLTGGVTRTYVRETVALTLELTPHLSDEENIRLELNGEISDVVPDSTSDGGPTTNQRKLTTTVVVRDGETVVLGGLQKESAIDTVSKVPVLGDIPLLGRLFQTRGKTRVKQDLLIILTPYVIRDDSDLRRIYDRKDSERRELAERASMFAEAGAYDPHVDYARKRGALQEINLASVRAENESRALADARSALASRRSLRPGEVRIPEPSLQPPPSVQPEAPRALDLPLVSP